MNIPTSPTIFDERRRHAMRERANRRGADSGFLWHHLADDIADRLSVVSRTFNRTAIIGPLGQHAATILGERDSEVTLFKDALDDDWLLVEPESYDLIISGGILDSVNDLPGALLRARFALKPDGLFLGHMFGASTLQALKSAMLSADGSRPMSHIHPQIELRSAADLLSRSGFALPVADIDNMSVRYSDWRRLISDLRDMGLGNALTGHRSYLGHDYQQRLDEAWRPLADGDGKVSETFTHIHMSGWAPSPDQPKPARRGSGVSLAAILLQPGQLSDDDK